MPVPGRDIAATRAAAFSRTPLIDERRSAPLVVVGLPRTGSSYLSHLLSHLDEWYVFDDLYLYRQVKALGATGPLSPRQLAELVEYLEGTVRIHIEDPKYVKYALDLRSVALLADAVREAFAGRAPYWHELMEEWLTRIALVHGRSRWGFKTPQAFMYLSELAKLFPSMRVLYLQRDPRRVMASLKNLSGRDGSPGQYHPVAYSLYWRLAERTVEKWLQQEKVPVYRVCFETLVQHPEREMGGIEEFLDSSLATGNLSVRPNSSFSGTKPRRAISGLEERILSVVARRELLECGYLSPPKRLRVLDFLDFAWVSLRFVGYQAVRLKRDRGARQSVRILLQRLLADLFPVGKNLSG